ncbi:MAG TPA: class I SAM-dependent methyltransferase [bacterium]|nr:class I SAM-dependent methyltransferase [bacterium]
MNDDPEVSRFFRRTDPHEDRFVFDLPKSWWSRPYEYAWAASFAQESDTALDAACGICHPLKFHLSDTCRVVHACDLDERILSPEAIKKDIISDFGDSALDTLPTRYFDKISYAQASILSLPYADESFDKIYCISVLEHLRDFGNRYPLADLFLSRLSSFLPYQIGGALKEFRRVLRDQGRVILTFDYPKINLGYLNRAVIRAGLDFVRRPDFTLPDDALQDPKGQLYCFRTVLRKAHEGKP